MTNSKAKNIYTELRSDLHWIESITFEDCVTEGLISFRAARLLHNEGIPFRKFLLVREIHLSLMQRTSYRRAWCQSLTNKKLRVGSKKLVQCSQSRRPPQPFAAFVRIMENTTGVSLEGKFEVSLEDIKALDKDSILKYTTKSKRLTELNLDMFVIAALIVLSSVKQLDPHLTDDLTDHDLEDLLSQFPQSTSSCFPLYRKKSDVGAVAQAIDWFREWESNGFPSSDIQFQPVTLFHRFQTSLKDGVFNVKARQVWGVPYSVLLCESILFRRTINSYGLQSLDLCKRSGRLPIFAAGLTPLQIFELVIQRTRRICEHDVNMEVSTIDVSKFDQSIPPEIESVLHSILLCSSNREGCVEMILKMFDYQVFTPFVYEKDELKFMDGGLVSGSLKTNLTGSIASAMVNVYTSLEATNYGETSIGDFTVMGDDNHSILVNYSYAHLKQVYERFGLTISETKSTRYQGEASTGTYSFLGRFWDRKGPFQTREYFISRFAVPQRWLKNQEVPISVLQTYRALSIASGFYNGFEEFEHLIGLEDHIFAGLITRYEENPEAVIQLVTEDQRVNNMRVPIQDILQGTSWKSSAFLPPRNRSP